MEFDMKSGSLVIADEMMTELIAFVVFNYVNGVGGN